MTVQRVASSDQWLAVIDGRFLPVDEYDLSIENDTQKVHSGTLEKSKMLTTSSSMEGTIETRRRPSVNPGTVEQLRLRGPDTEWQISNIAARVVPSLDGTYTIEFEAISWECCQR